MSLTERKFTAPNMNTSRISETKSNLADAIIEYTYYALFFFVPLIWLPFTSELFEFNKMIIVYIGASVVLTAWLYKSVSEGKFIYKRTPLDIPIFLFLFANIAATVFSIDQHTSIFGYYSRFNGGLLSTISYITLYFAFVTFFDREKLMRLLKILLFSAAIVAAYAVLQHPNPLFRNPDGSFRGIDAGFWNQNAEARAFSTLGHPNWLAAFMVMVIPIAGFFLVALKQVWERLLISAALIGFFLAFTFTYSRGGTVGFIAMVAVLTLGLLFTFRREIWNYLRTKQISQITSYAQPPKIGFFLTLVFIGWLIIFYFFGNAFTSRGVNFAAIKAEGDTQLAATGSETGRIRLIVWKGGWEIFKNSPIFGSGLETFAFSYYLFRPPEHNFTSEWDFLYNKAHNEFVTYLSTTGGLGILTYLILIITPGVLVITYLNQKHGHLQKILAVLVLADLAGYHAQNFFGFSVVPIALLFYLFPAFFFVDSQLTKVSTLPLRFLRSKRVLFTAKTSIAIIGILLTVGVSSMWLADFYYTKGTSGSNDLKNYNELKLASALRPDEPLYKAALGLTTMNLAINEGDEQKKQAKVAESFSYLNAATTTSPANISVWRHRLQALFDLASMEAGYKPQVVKTAKIMSDLAPTEAQIQYNLASMQVFAGDFTSAQKQLEKVVNLKFNYKGAWELLLQVDSQLGDKKSQNRHLRKFEEYFPDEDF